jgi:hypothetical protein
LRLEADGKSIDDPTKGDLIRALPKGDMPDDWSLVLERNNDDTLEAESRPTGGFSVNHFGNGVVENTDEAIDAAVLRKLLVLYFEGNANWKHGIAWKRHTKAATTVAGVSTIQWRNRLVQVIPFLFAAVTIWLMFGGSLGVPGFGEIVDSIPVPSFLESEPAKMVAGFGLVVFLVFLIALIVAMREVRQMRSWVAVTARIVRSEPGFELHRTSQRDLPNNVRVAKIAYEYSYMGATRTGARVNTDKIPSAEEADRLLRDYPVGKTVTAYCNPKNPSEVVIERDPPKQLALGCSVATLIGVAVIAGIIWLINIGPERLVAAFPSTVLPVFIPTLLGGIVFLAFFFAALKQKQRFRRFQTATGTVLHTFVKEFKVEREDNDRRYRRRRYTTMFMPVVEYRYSVGGVDQLSRSIRLSGETSGSKAYAEGIAAKYPGGASVKVYYDPDKPDSSALQTPSNWFWLLLVPVPILFWLAWRFSGLA